MGAKGVKAIILDDTGCSMRRPKDPDKFKEANKRFVAGIKKHPVIGEGFPAYGTNIMTNVINEAGAYPTNNFQLGRFDTCSKISGETQAEIENERGGEGTATHGCHRGCVIRCSGTYYDKDFNQKAGFAAQHDRLPDFLLKEKLPTHHTTFIVKENLDQVINW
jgi:aldehyde:ferredoxin oxidoreductase